ncbi:hypothetical protein P607_03805 [Comamonas thiooxydans]|nr:hypothetical protein P607_03805 [Comamonas thiooxydans]
MIQSQVLIQGLPADTEFTCQLRFLLAGCGPLPQFGDLFGRQCFLTVIFKRRLHEVLGADSTMPVSAKTAWLSAS